jgi:outer membrane protein TolC
LEETLHLVVSQNLQVESARTELDAAEASRKAEWGIWEPRLIISYGKTSDEKENNVQDALARNPIFAEPVEFYDTHNDRLSIGLEQTLPTGAQVRIGTDWTFLRNNLQERSNIDEEFESYAGVSIRQPLLKGAGFGVTMARIRLAASRSDQTREEIRGELMNILSQAEVAYWEVYRNRREVEYREESVERATKLLKDNRARLEAGRMSTVDVAQAEAALAMRQSQLAEARQNLADAMAQLVIYIGEDSNARIVVDPVDVLEFSPRVTDFIDSMKNAMANHPTLGSLEDQVDQAQIQKKVAFNYRFPRLDFTAGYGVNGYGLGPRSSYEALVDGDYHSWYVGLELEVPLFTGIRERQELIASRHRLRGAQAEFDATRMELASLIHAMIDRVASTRSQVEQYQNVVNLSEKVLDAELSSLESGRGDSRDVLQAEEDLTDARVAYLRSLVNYRRTLISLEVLEGAYLRNHSIELVAEIAQD